MNIQTPVYVVGLPGGRVLEQVKMAVQSKGGVCQELSVADVLNGMPVGCRQVVVALDKGVEAVWHSQLVMRLLSANVKLVPVGAEADRPVWESMVPVAFSDLWNEGIKTADGICHASLPQTAAPAPSKPQNYMVNGTFVFVEHLPWTPLATVVDEPEGGRVRSALRYAALFVSIVVLVVLLGVWMVGSSDEDSQPSATAAKAPAENKTAVPEAPREDANLVKVRNLVDEAKSRAKIAEGGEGSVSAGKLDGLEKDIVELTSQVTQILSENPGLSDREDAKELFADLFGALAGVMIKEGELLVGDANKLVENARKPEAKLDDITSMQNQMGGYSEKFDRIAKEFEKNEHVIDKESSEKFAGLQAQMKSRSEELNQVLHERESAEDVNRTCVEVCNLVRWILNDNSNLANRLELAFSALQKARESIKGLQAQEASKQVKDQIDSANTAIQQAEEKVKATLDDLCDKLGAAEKAMGIAQDSGAFVKAAKEVAKYAAFVETLGDDCIPDALKGQVKKLKGSRHFVWACTVARVDGFLGKYGSLDADNVTYCNLKALGTQVAEEIKIMQDVGGCALEQSDKDAWETKCQELNTVNARILSSLEHRKTEIEGCKQSAEAALQEVRNGKLDLAKNAREQAQKARKLFGEIEEGLQDVADVERIVVAAEKAAQAAEKAAAEQAAVEKVEHGGEKVSNEKEVNAFKLLMAALNTKKASDKDCAITALSAVFKSAKTEGYISELKSRYSEGVSRLYPNDEEMMREANSILNSAVRRALDEPAGDAGSTHLAPKNEEERSENKTSRLNGCSEITTFELRIYMRWLDFFDSWEPV